MSDGGSRTILGNVGRIIAPLADDWRSKCVRHSETPGIAVCRRCGAGMCHECVADANPLAPLLCAACAVKEKGRTSLLKVLLSFRLPILWVLLCVSIAGISYAMGVGNPDIAEITRRDVKRLWWQRQAGMIHLGQASRCRKRAATLRHYGSRKEAIAVWSRRSAAAFAAAIAAWDAAPVLPDLQIAEAEMLTDAGNPAKALDVLSRLNVPVMDQAYPAYRLVWAAAAAKIGRPKTEIDPHLNAVIAELDRRELSIESNLDKMIEVASSEYRGEGELTAKVRLICGTRPSPREVRTKCLKMLGVKSDGTEIPVPASRLPDKRPTDSAVKDGDGVKPKNGKDFEVEFIQ